MLDVAARFLSHQKARLTPKAYIREAGVVNEHLCPFFVGPIASIRRVDVQRFITKRSPEVSAHSVQKELNILKHLLRLAVEWEIVPINVSQGVKAPRVPAGRVRYLQPGELRAVLEASPDWLRPIVVLAACTGMRRSELLGLRWLDVDLSHNRVMLVQTKNGEGRVVCLNETAKAVCRRDSFYRLAIWPANRRAGQHGVRPRVQESEDFRFSLSRSSPHRSKLASDARR